MDRALVLKQETSFDEAIEAIDSGGIGFIAMVDEAGYLLGILTDGDIRRAFLNKNFNLKSVINTNPEVMLESSTNHEVYSRLKMLHRRHMPLVDENKRFKGVFTLDDVDFFTRDNVVVIMAGGLGSRLGELTKEVPKPMLKVGKQPMLQHLVEMFSEQGFRKFIFCVNYKKSIIQDYFQEGRDFGVKIDYIEEESRLGTAGALSLIEAEITEPFFVVNADVLTNLDFLDVLNAHKATRSQATMCVRKHYVNVPLGVVNNKDGRIVSIEEKPEVSFDVNAGVYCLNPEVLQFVPKKEFFDMPTLFNMLIDNDLMVSVHHVHEYWLDIGRKDDFQKANKDLSY